MQAEKFSKLDILSQRVHSVKTVNGTCFPMQIVFSILDSLLYKSYRSLEGQLHGQVISENHQSFHRYNLSLLLNE